MSHILDSRFRKKFKKLPPQIQGQFFERLQLFETDPYSLILNNHSVNKAYPGCRSINVTGNYRAIYHLKLSIAIFINIGTHAELYK